MFDARNMQKSLRLKSQKLKMAEKPIHRQVTGLSEEKPPVPLQATSVLYVEGAPVAGWWPFVSPKAQCH
jgi:beta-xylosidase